ncbi:GntR family transcriptional regulator [Herbidospora sp. RD11066]
MSPSVERSDPPYVQVVNHIRGRIRSGELKEGETIPSARQIAKDWGIALATATKVLASLRSEGLVEALPGRGTIVSTVRRHTSPRDRFQAIRLADETARIMAAETAAAPEQVADALGLAPGATVIRRHRVTMKAGRPVSASTSWFDGALAATAPELLVAERITAGTLAYVERRTGRTAVSGRDQQCADTADDHDAEDLGVPLGTTVLRGRNWVYDQEGAVLEYGEYVTVAGRWSTYEYGLERQGNS